MVGFENIKKDLGALDAEVIAASVDPIDKAREVANDVSYPIAHGMTRTDAEKIGAWWDEKRGILQPSEFIIGADGKVLSSTYSSGPIGRLSATDVVKLLNHYEKSKKGT